MFSAISKWFVGFLLSINALLCSTFVAAECIQNNSQTNTILSGITVGISTIEGESYLRERLDMALACDDKRQIAELKFSLGALWNDNGIELSQALIYMQDVADYYWPQKKWNRKRYSSALLKIAELHYKKGAFHLSFQIIRELETTVASWGKMPNEVFRNKESLKLLLAIALHGVVKIEVNPKLVYDDISVFQDANDIDSTPIASIFSSDLLFRQAMGRIVRWAQWLDHTKQGLPEEWGLKDIDYRIELRTEADFVDELYIDYSIARLLFVDIDRCETPFAKLIIHQFDKQQIHRAQNKIAALAIVAECSSVKRRNEFLKSYISSMTEFYASMPLDFSAEVYLFLNSSLRQLIDNISWNSESENLDFLLQLLQLKQRSSVVSTDARFNPKGIANQEARKAYIRREEIKNTYFKYNQPALAKKFSSKIESLRSQLERLDEQIANEYPSLSRLATTNTKSALHLRKNLPNHQQLLLLGATEKKICAVLVNNIDIEGHCTQLTAKDLQSNLKGLTGALRDASDNTLSLSTQLSANIFQDMTLETSKYELIISTDSNLASLPVNALYYAKEQIWLLEKFNIQRITSLAALNDIKPSSALSIKKRLAVANPLFNLNTALFAENEEIDSFRSSVGRFKDKLTAIRGLVSLKETESEARMFVPNAQMGTTLIQGKANEVEIVKALESNWDIIVFSTHTLFPEQVLNLDYPGLALTPVSEDNNNDGLLSSSEITALSFNRALVILAACDTANSIGRRNSLGSLLDSFLISGARSVLASHWKVNSVETNVFMELLALNLAKYGSDAEAIWETRKALVKTMPARVWSSFDFYH